MSLNIDLNSLDELDDRISEEIIDNIEKSDLQFDLSNFKLKVDYTIEVDITNITLEKKKD